MPGDDRLGWLARKPRCGRKPMRVSERARVCGPAATGRRLPRESPAAARVVPGTEARSLGGALRPESLLARAHGGIETRSSPVQRAAGAAPEGAQAVRRSL